MGLLAVALASACAEPPPPDAPPAPEAWSEPSVDETSSASDESTATPPDDPPVAPRPWSVLSYNVAGLPQGLSSSDPAVNTSQMSSLLNAYDLVLVQEDFRYHAELAANAQHAFQSTPMQEPALGDGLNCFSASPFADFQRHAWTACHGALSSGSDCLTPKGFTVATHTLAPGVAVDVYDLHMDAGRGSGDRAARVAQGEQLAAVIAQRSAGRAVVVMGDTNWKEGDDADLVAFLAAAQLADVCRVTACPNPSLHDRVMFRSSAIVELVPVTWRIDTRFVDAAGLPLSDHDAIAVDFTWATPDGASGNEAH